MSDVRAAYDALLGLTSQGRDFLFDEILLLPADDPRTGTVFGHGLEFTTTVPVMNPAGPGTTDGRVSLRILRAGPAAEPRLYLRTRLDWTTPAGDKHTSLAKYDITAAAADRLAATGLPEGDDFSDIADRDPESFTEDEADELQQRFFGAIWEGFSEAAHYQADWDQKFPGSDYFEFATDDDVAELDATARYHSRAVITAQEQAPQLLCMLSDTESGVVGPQELVDLLAWVRQQPEVAIHH